jgi:adenine phosphoribosyltransferase
MSADAQPSRSGPIGRAADTLDRLTRVVSDFPVPGVLFRDLTPVLADAEGLRALVEGLATAVQPGKGHGAASPLDPDALPDTSGVDLIAGLEARGFLLSAALAQHLGTGVLAIRKAGKLPGRLVSQEYSLEYGTASLEVNPDDIGNGSRVLLVDDVLATGGTAAAGRDLLERCGAEVIGLAVAIELDALGGRGRLAGLPVTSLRRY